MSRRTVTVALTVTLGLLLGLPVAAEDNWRMRLNLVGMDHGASNKIDVSGDQVSLEGGLGIGVAIDWEYRFNSRIGLDIGLMAAVEENLEVRVDQGGGGTRVEGGTLAVAPITLGVNVHLTPNAPVDVYVGAMAGYVNYGSVDFDIATGGGGGNMTTVDVGVGSDFAPGAIVGLDVPIGRRGWVFNTSVRALDASIETENGGVATEFEYDPVVFGLGFGWTF